MLSFECRKLFRLTELLKTFLLWGNFEVLHDLIKLKAISTVKLFKQLHFAL